ncbi:MAG: DUF2851 family protein [Planctomycetes bacterium]|nr:DUF2851 family protein [Planctomycetota bacterium]
MGYPKIADVFTAFPRARQYRLLRDKVSGIPKPRNVLQCADKKREPELEKITEKFIYYLWAEQPLKGLTYRTSDDKEIRIVSSGLWNSSPGPDFTEARFYIGGKLYQGDVEMHLYSSDWYYHKHHLDNRYNNLVLHITLWDDAQKPIRLNNKKEVSQVILAPLLRDKLEDIDKLLELDVSINQGQYFTAPGRCHSLINRAIPQKTASFLEGAGESRMLRKMENLAGRLERFNNDYEEVLYQGIMGALGYRNNQLPFLQLAENVPYKRIKQIIKQYPVDKRPLVIQSALLNVAGLTPEIPDNFTEPARYYLKCLNEFADLSDGLKRIGLDWQIPGGRPANSPCRRIAGMSYLLTKEPSLLDGIIKIITNQPDIRKELIGLLSVPATGFWATHSTFDSKPFTKEYALIGKERADAIILNVVIPLVWLYSQSEKNNALQEAVLRLYRSYPKLMENYYTRFMKQRLFKSDPKLYLGAVNTASTQQGLIEIFTDFCKKGYEGCEHCGLLEWLKN